MKLNKNPQAEYFREITEIISSARKQAYSSINKAMVQAYWKIGERIVKEEQQGDKRAEYGKFIIENISKELSMIFGKGFSERRIREYRQFYLSFYEMRHTLSAELKSIDIENVRENQEIRRTLFAELIDQYNLSWSHYRLIMRVNNPKAQKYYLQEASKNAWSVRTLDRNIATQYFERLLLSQNTESIEGEMKEKNKVFQKDKFEFIKNPTVLEFLNLPSNYGFTENELENALIDHLQEFILELGKGYAFIEQQKLIRTEARDYHIDLVFYNYILKCFILIDLKTERITHQDVGQMDMYVRMFDEHHKQVSDNPTLGIVLCSDTDSDIARYSILKGNEQIFASKYKLYLPAEEELKNEIERQKLNFKLQQGGRHV